jgi:CheY-like chemotaxis protein
MNIEVTSLSKKSQKVSATAAAIQSCPATDRPKTDFKRNILLAEDNHVNQAVAMRTIQKLGHSLVVANNGKDALALMAKQSFDLVLMDIQMPEMDRLTATKAIREAERQT